MIYKPLFEEIGKRLGKQPDEVRATLQDTAEILNCMAEMRESVPNADGATMVITVGIKGTARILEQLTQQ